MQLSILGAVAGFAAVTTIYIVAVVVYRLTFHPLAKYPGPFWAKITSFYDLYHIGVRDRHLDQHRCHEKYGPVVRYGPNTIVINTTTGLRDIYTGSKHVNIQKGPSYRYLFEPTGAASTHATIDKDVHAIKRRIMSHGFSEQGLRSLEPYMIENIDKWIEAIGADAKEENKGWTPARNMANWANYVTFDVLGDLCFGKSFEMINSEKLRGVTDFLMTRVVLFHFIGNSPILSFWKRWVEPYKVDYLVMPESAKLLAGFTQFAATSIKERFARADLEKNSPEHEQRKDFFYWLLRGQDAESTTHHYTPSELVAEARLLITAGSDTSSITIAATCFYLSRHPEVLAKLQHELRSNFTDANDITTGPELTKCHYLRAIIDEALRMTPPVPASLQREVTNDGMTINGEFFPAGTLVGTSAYALHHNKEYYSDPDVFRPERWLVDEAGTNADEVNVAKSAFCPFSLGTRGCIGKPMAYNELSIALGRLFFIYDMRLQQGDHTGEGPKGHYNQKDVFVSERDGPWVQFRRRE